MASAASSACCLKPADSSCNDVGSTTASDIPSVLHDHRFLWWLPGCEPGASSSARAGSKPAVVAFSKRSTALQFTADTGVGSESDSDSDSSKTTATASTSRRTRRRKLKLARHHKRRVNAVQALCAGHNVTLGLLVDSD